MTVSAQDSFGSVGSCCIWLGRWGWFRFGSEKHGSVRWVHSVRGWFRFGSVRFGSVGAVLVHSAQTKHELDESIILSLTFPFFQNFGGRVSLRTVSVLQAGFGGSVQNGFGSERYTFMTVLNWGGFGSVALDSAFLHENRSHFCSDSGAEHSFLSGLQRSRIHSFYLFNPTSNVSSERYT